MSKTIITRIQNKSDSISNWADKNSVLLKGEIAAVTVPTGSSYTNPVTGKSEPVIELLMKVGDGTTAFNSLPWLSAKASDVYDWGKAATVEYNGTDLKIHFKKADGTTISSVDLSPIDAKIANKLSDIAVTQSGSGGVVQSITKTATGEITVTNGTVVADDIASNAVTTVKIANTAVTNEKIAAGVSSDKINIGTSTTSGTLTAKLKAIDAKVASKSDAHDHPYLSNTTKYAGSSSQGGAATSANKVNKSLTVQLNGGTTEGTNKFTFDGSAAKSVNITPTSIGAALASHSHDEKYYTETEIDAKLSTINSLIDEHDHDDVYIKPADVDTKINTALGSVLKYKGTKTTTSMLPTSGNAVGDVWNITNASAASDSIPAVNAGDNVAWNGSAWDVLAGTIDLSSYYNKSEVDAALASKSDTNHTHKYAGSSSIGGPANSVKASLTFNNSGSGAASNTTFNGSTAKTISYNTVGAAAASHTHTKSEITDFDHNHDDRYYTESEVDAAIAANTITANAEDDDVVVLTGTSGTNSVKYKATHANSGITVGTYRSVTVDAKGHVTKGTNPTTISEYGITDAYTKADVYTKTEINSELAKKADSEHNHSDYVNQNAFSNIKVGTTTVAADTITDTVEFVGSNITITPDATKDKITFKVAKADADGKTGIVTLEDSIDANQSTTAATSKAVYNVNQSVLGLKTKVIAVEADYVRVGSDSKFYVGKTGTEEIIFDCGGAF